MPSTTDHNEEHIRIFLCYRDKDAETAKNIWLAMKESDEYDFGSVWFSDCEPVGNYYDEIPQMISQAEYAVLFISKDFTGGFLNSDDSVNTDCITALEMIEIERNRQAGSLKVCSVNIDGNKLAPNEIEVLEKLFGQSGILKDDSVSRYRYMNVNTYLRRQTKPKAFVSERMRSIALCKRTEKKDEKEIADKAKESFELAAEAQKAKKHSEAIKYFSEAIKLDPNNYQAYGNRGYEYSIIGEHRKAIEDFTSAIELDPSASTAFQYRGYTYFKIEEYEKAISDYTTALDLDPTLMSILSKRADAYLAMGKIREAENDRETLEAYERSKHQQQTAEDYNNRGKRALLDGDLGLAKERFTKAIELKPDFEEAYLNRGRVYRQTHDYPLAIRDYSKAIELNPQNAETFINRGYIYDEIKEYDKAVRDNSKAIRLNPHSITAYINRSYVYCHKKEYKKAIDDANKAIELGPKEAYPYCNRGIANDGLGNYKEAITDLSVCLHFLSQNDVENRALGLYYRGNSYYNLKDYGNALVDFTTALSLKPNCSKALRGRAKTYRALGRKGLALADDKHAKKIERELETT